jgi:paraquat-inducible protein B
MSDDRFSDTPAVPASARVQARRLPSPIWLIPAVTVLVAAWLAWDTLSKRGPLVTVTFESAEGLVAGQSQIKYRDVVMGQVQTIELNDDLAHVTVTARMNAEAERLLTERARFWVVKPRLFAGNISGLETVLSGSYVALLPSAEPAPAARHFKGLEDPPVLQSSTAGHTFLLKARLLGSINLGSPVFYRGLDVGEVLGWDIADMAESVTIHAFVRAPFDQYVHEESHFWNASGLAVELGSNGLRVQVESLRALLLGGVAFDTPFAARETPVVEADKTIFPLYADKNAADEAGFKRRVTAVAYFPGAVDGLARGAPVTLRGIRIGEVTSVRLEYDPKSDTIRVPVRLEVQPERIGDVGAIEGRGPLDNLRHLVALGMRAQLQSVNLLTGQKSVSFDVVPDAPPAEVTIENGLIVVPTAPDQFGGIISSVNSLVSQLNKMPFQQIGANLNETLAGLNKITNGPAMHDMLVSLQAALAAAKEMLVSLNAGAGPAMKRLPEIATGLQEAVTRANRVLQSVDAGYGDNSKFYRNLDRLLVQLNDAAQSIRVLSDILARHPEALLRGRTDSGEVK